MKSIIILVILIMGCTSSEDNLRNEVFDLQQKNSELVNFDTVKTVSDLNDLYCQIAQKDKSKKLMLPFDFRMEKFNEEANTGIAVIGHPMYCFPILCCRRTLKFELKEKEWKVDLHPEINNIDSLVSLNMMNYGYDPMLSDQPKDALFEISASPETELKSLNKIIGEIAKAYLKFLKDKASDSITISSLKEEFPLNIMISKLQDIPPVPVDSTFMEEIEDDIKIDLK